MKHTRFLLTCTVLAMLSLFSANAHADRTIKYSRDLDGDGHYNVKTIKVNDNRRYHSGYGHGYRSGYYGSGYRNYGYRNYGYRGYGYRGYGYPRSYVGFGFSRPAYRTVVVNRTVRASSSLTADVQSELAQKGYYRGQIDGDFGPRTRAAIRSYQVDRGLNVTGSINDSLIRSLKI